MKEAEAEFCASSEGFDIGAGACDEDDAVGRFGPEPGDHRRIMAAEAMAREVERDGLIAFADPFDDGGEIVAHGLFETPIVHAAGADWALSMPALLDEDGAEARVRCCFGEL